MNYRLNILSLEQMTLIRTAVALWNQDGIKASMRAFYELFNSEEAVDCYMNWCIIEGEVRKTVERLSLPLVLQWKTFDFIKTIGSQILSWMDYHRFLSLRLHLPNEFRWTPQGELDFKKTAEVLLKDWDLDMNSRFILACIYCFEDEIQELWYKIPEHFRMDCEKDTRDIRQLVVFWTFYMKKEVARIYEIIGSSENPQRSLIQYEFEMAAKVYSKAAAQYFLKKMHSKERKESLVRAAGYAVNAFHRYITFERHKEKNAVLFFLLSEMDEQQQMEVFKIDAYEVLVSFLYWPRQGLFMEAAIRGLEFLSGDYYSLLLGGIFNKLGNYDYDYQELFREFWKQSHDSHKKHTIDECASDEDRMASSLFSALFENEDAENIGLILKSATAIQRERIIFSNKGKGICETLLTCRKWGLLKFFIGECISSKNTLISFKEELEAFLSVKGHLYKLYQLIDELIHKCNEKD